MAPFLGILVQLFRAEQLHAAVLQQIDPVGKAAGQRQIVGGNHGGETLINAAAQQLHDELSGSLVLCIGGLVQQKKRPVARQHGQQSQPPLLPLTQFIGGVLAPGQQVKFLQQCPGLLAQGLLFGFGLQCP